MNGSMYKYLIYLPSSVSRAPSGGGPGPPTFLRVGKIKTHNKLSVECSPFKTKKQYSKLSRKTYLSSIINKTLPLFGEKAKKNKQLPSLPPKKNKVTLVIYFCEKTLPLFGKKG